MKKIRWRMMAAICLLLSLIPFTTMGQVLARVSQQPTSAINLLLQGQEEPQASRSVEVQSIIGLLLQDDEDGQQFQIFLPVVRR